MQNNIDIGAKIRQYRLANKMSMKELAESANITQSMLSQIERNLANPSINTLRLIADTLKVPIFQFFVDNKDVNKFVVTPDTRKQLAFNDDNGLIYELLTPDLRGDIQFCRMVLPAGMSSVSNSMHHEGEEVAFVISGKVDIFIDKSKIALEEKHSIRIPAGIDHRWENNYNEDVDVIFAITPPSF
ncbi:helix-turn-helix domain-containing protein [Clostridium sp.]|uniref:helix-turn-helix domain-containing protein n=1 Tax=Clostridium sp. TaxID=1506 RepID=UPI003464AD3A